MAKLTVKRFTDLSETHDFYLGLADQYAEYERAKYITSGNGQAMTYEAKHQEALAGDGPLIRAEAQALDMSVSEVVESVLTARTQWEQAEAVIEAARLKAKKEIRSAKSAAEAHNAVLTMQSVLSGLGGGK